MEAKKNERKNGVSKVRIKDFNCCGSNEWLISRSEARQLVRGFRQDLKEGLVDWSTTFGFCIGCGGVFSFFDACSQKDEDYCIAFYNQQMKRSSSQSFAHKIRKNGGPSQKLLKTLERDKRGDSRMMSRVYDKRREAVAEMKRGGKE